MTLSEEKSKQKNMELSFGEILQQQKKSGVKRAKPAKPSTANYRGNDEAPFEMSSKRPKKMSHFFEKSSAPSIDPRFSSQYGKLNEDKFRENFKHAFEMRDKELDELKQKKRRRKNQQEDDVDEVEDVSKQIKKMENQKREFDKKINKKIRPTPKELNYYPNKRKQRAEDLLNKFKELKESGQLEKYLDKRRKKQSGKSRKKMNIEK